MQIVLAELDGATSDEHGAWETGCNLDSKKRGVAVNVDIYGVAIVAGQPLGVVQVRQYYKRSANAYPDIHKSYFLVGRNENGRAFAHCVGYAPIRAAARISGASDAPVGAALRWIWGLRSGEMLNDVCRHGDCALICRQSAPRGHTISATPCCMRLADSHVLDAAALMRNGEHLYARDARLTHLKGQHPDTYCPGWSRVVVGRREASHSFASPTSD